MNPWFGVLKLAVVVSGFVVCFLAREQRLVARQELQADGKLPLDLPPQVVSEHNKEDGPGYDGKVNPTEPAPVRSAADSLVD
jgi:hypothetical protein